MPTYDYVCTACQNAWEEVQKITAPALEDCPKCGGKTAKRQVSGGSFILKGGGWYADLYASSKPAAKSGEGGGTSASSDASPAKAETSAKSETAAPAAATPAATPKGTSTPKGST